MPTRRLPDDPNDPWVKLRGLPCRDPDHNPPTMMVYEPGLYEHTCRACGQVQRFGVQRTYCY